jgi:hypothetical protein
LEDTAMRPSSQSAKAQYLPHFTLEVLAELVEPVFDRDQNDRQIAKR